MNKQKKTEGFLLQNGFEAQFEGLGGASFFNSASGDVVAR